MADETIAANKIHTARIAYGGRLDLLRDFTEIYAVNGTDISGGLIVTTASETSPDVDLQGTAEQIAGPVLDYANIAEYKENYSLGVTIADNKLIDVLNPRLSRGRILCQLVLSRSTSTAAAMVKGTAVFAENGSGKVTVTHPGGTTAEKTYIGVLAEAVASGTADKVVPVWV